MVYMGTNIVEISQKNWQRYKYFLLRIMQSEFPINQQLSERQIYYRIANREEFNGRAMHRIAVVEKVAPVGFIVFHRYATDGTPIGLIEYTAVEGVNKSQGHGKTLVDYAKDTLEKEGVDRVVIEVDMVPRVVSWVHEDISDFPITYVGHGTRYMIIKGTGARWDETDRKKCFWEDNGFRIISSFPYTQWDLAREKVEGRVPLDLHVTRLSGADNSMIPVPDLRQLVYAIAEQNYKVPDAQGFVALQFNQDYLGRKLNDGSVKHIEVVSYSTMLNHPDMVEAMKIFNLKSRYKQK